MPGRTDRPQSERSATLALIAGAVVVAAVRWWTSRARDVFHMTPDEPGQLAIARFVGGGTRWNMFDHSTWRPGFGTFIAPIAWFTDDPETAFRVALVVNALLGGVSCVLLCLLARRLTAMSAPWCVTAAVTVSLAPALLFTTDWVWSEALVQVTYLAFVLTALRFAAAPSFGWGVVLAMLAAVAFATHSRMLPLSIVVAGIVVASMARRSITPWRGVALLGLQTMSIIGVWRYSQFLVDRLWEDPRQTNTAGGVLAQLGEGPSIAVSAVGQAWYQLVATAGIAGLGTLVLIRSARRRSDGRPRPGDARLVLVIVGLLVGLSIVFMADRWRPDQVVYGRYNDVSMAPVVVVGVGALVTLRRARLIRDMVLVLAVTVAAGIVLRVVRDEELRASGGVRSMMLGLIGYLGGATSIRVTGVTVVAALLIAGVGLVAAAASGRARGALVLAALVLLVAGGYARARPIVDRGTNSWAVAEDVRSLRDDVLPAGVPVRQRLVPERDDPSASWSQQRQRAMLYQFYLPDNPMSADVTAAEDPWTPYVFAPLGDPDLIAAGAELVWRDPGVAIGLWIEPSP